MPICLCWSAVIGPIVKGLNSQKEATIGAPDSIAYCAPILGLIDTSLGGDGMSVQDAKKLVLRVPGTGIRQ
jgi:hypothetical protein